LLDNGPSGFPDRFLQKTHWNLPSVTSCNVSVLFEFLLPSFAANCRTAAKSGESPGKPPAIGFIITPHGYDGARVGNPDAFLSGAGGVEPVRARKLPSLEYRALAFTTG
jgi:hypothetical protein